jgi:peroxiredoxin
MIPMHALLLLALLQAAPAGEPLRSGCSADAPQIGSVGPGDRVAVQSALAGEGPTCYKIDVIRPGQSLTGYVIGESLPAIQDFVDGRERISAESAREEARRAREAELARTRASVQAAATEPTDPLVSTQFADFAGRDVNGRPVSLASLKGRATVVTFWKPGSARSVADLEHELPLYNQFHKSGLAAVGVSMDPRPDRINEVLDDITLPWPQMPDQSGLAARYGVDPKAGKTFVLDADHRIVAAGPMGPEIDKAIRQLLATPENQ